jgi:hypothetical protein
VPAFKSVLPATYTVYFTAASTSAAALIGLLFVAVSLRDDSIFGSNAIPSRRALATSSFIALVNSFFVALLALVPAGNVGIGALIMAVVSATAAVRLQRRLPRDRWHVVLAAFTFVTYAAQFAEGAVLIIAPHETGFVTGVAYQLFASMAVALQRAWRLLSSGGLDEGGPSQGRSEP